MDAIRLESYSTALAEEFRDDVDTLKVLDKLVRSRRAEFESRIPDMGDLLHMVRETRWARLKAADDERERAMQAERERDYREHPENYCTVKEIYDDWAARQAEKLRQTQQPWTGGADELAAGQHIEERAGEA